MLDPVTAAATATAAFNTIKKGFEIGRDIEQMAGDIGRWMSCLSDMEQAEKEAKNPPIFKKLFNGSSAEQEALQIFIANKRQKNRENNFVIIMDIQWVNLRGKNWFGGKAKSEKIVKRHFIDKENEESTL